MFKQNIQLWDSNSTPPWCWLVSCESTTRAVLFLSLHRLLIKNLRKEQYEEKVEQKSGYHIQFLNMDNLIIVQHLICLYTHMSCRNLKKKNQQRIHHAVNLIKSALFSPLILYIQVFSGRLRLASFHPNIAELKGEAGIAHAGKKNYRL